MRWWHLVSSVVVCVMVSGCTAVPAWERARLAQPCMLPEPRPMSAGFAEHVYDYREGSVGGSGIVGGGCGCN